MSWLQYEGKKVLPFPSFPFCNPSVRTHNATAQYNVKNVLQIMTSGARGLSQTFILMFYPMQNGLGNSVYT